MRGGSLAVMVAILCMAILLTSCSGEGPTCPWAKLPPGLRPRTSVQNLLHNLHMVYDERNLTALDSLLAKDYRFYFAEEDQDLADEMEDGRQRFWFRRNPWTHGPSGDRIWTIVQWQELESESASPAAPDESTWGQIKCVFWP